MIVVGVVFVGLLLIALAGRALDDEGDPSPGFIVACVVLLALLLGIAHYRTNREDEF